MNFFLYVCMSHWRTSLFAHAVKWEPDASLTPSSVDASPPSFHPVFFPVLISIFSFTPPLMQICQQVFQSFSISIWWKSEISKIRKMFSFSFPGLITSPLLYSFAPSIFSFLPSRVASLLLHPPARIFSPLLTLSIFLCLSCVWPWGRAKSPERIEEKGEGARRKEKKK